MNKLHSLIVFLCFSFTAFSQAPPQAICYQAVATDAVGAEIVLAEIGVQISVLEGSETGPPVWIETHLPETDEFGLFDFNIGTGTRVGGSAANFEDIPWGANTYYLKVEMDDTGGSNYQFMGTNQIVSVPYALYSGNSANAENATNAMNAFNAVYADTANVAVSALNDMDTDPANELQNLNYDSITNILSIDGGNEVTISVDVNDADSDPANELQNLNYDPNTNILSIDGGNEVTISLDINDADSDPVNEIQTMTYDGENLSLVDQNGLVNSTINFGQFAMGRLGASFDFPQGLYGEHKVLTMGIYEVPFGKVFYVTGSTKEILFSHPTVDGGSILNHPSTPNMPIFPAGTVLTNCNCTGFEVNAEAAVEPVIIDLSGPGDSFTVPSGKVLFVKSGIANDAAGGLNINGIDIEFFRPNLSRWTRMMTAPGGATIKHPIALPITGDFVLTGYLISM